MRGMMEGIVKTILIIFNKKCNQEKDEASLPEKWMQTDDYEIFFSRKIPKESIFY